MLGAPLVLIIMIYQYFDVSMWCQLQGDTIPLTEVSIPAITSMCYSVYSEVAAFEGEYDKMATWLMSDLGGGKLL